MVLKINNANLESTYSSVSDSVPIGIRVSKKILSEPYLLSTGTLIKGRIISAYDNEEGFKRAKNSLEIMDPISNLEKYIKLARGLQQ